MMVRYQSGFGLVFVVLIANATELYRVGAIKSGLGLMLYLTINLVDDLTAGLSLAIYSYVLRR